MKAKLYKTAAPLKTVETMYHTFPRTCLYAVFSIPNPVRVRPAEVRRYVPEERIIYARGHTTPERIEPGQLLFFQRRSGIHAVPPPHEAMFVMECPSSVTKIEAAATNTEVEVAVYLPVNWLPHEAYAADRYPEPYICKRLLGVVNAAPVNEALCKAIGVPPSRTLSDNDLLRELGVNGRQLNFIRNRTLPRLNRFRAWCVYPRVPPPDTAPTLLRETYRRILASPTWNGYYVLSADGAEPWTGNFFGAVRDLCRLGCATIGDVLGIYPDRVFAPDWVLIEKEREAAFLNLREVAALVEAAPLYQTRQPFRART